MFAVAMELPSCFFLRNLASERVEGGVHVSHARKEEDPTSGTSFSTARSSASAASATYSDERVGESTSSAAAAAAAAVAVAAAVAAVAVAPGSSVSSSSALRSGQGLGGEVERARCDELTPAPEIRENRRRSEPAPHETRRSGQEEARHDLRQRRASQDAQLPGSDGGLDRRAYFAKVKVIRDRATDEARRHAAATEQGTNRREEEEKRKQKQKQEEEKKGRVGGRQPPERPAGAGGNEAPATEMSDRSDRTSSAASSSSQKRSRAASQELLARAVAAIADSSLLSPPPALAPATSAAGRVEMRRPPRRPTGGGGAGDATATAITTTTTTTTIAAPSALGAAENGDSGSDDYEDDIACHGTRPTSAKHRARRASNEESQPSRRDHATSTQPRSSSIGHVDCRRVGGGSVGKKKIVLAHSRRGGAAAATSAVVVPGGAAQQQQQLQQLQHQTQTRRRSADLSPFHASALSPSSSTFRRWSNDRPVALPPRPAVGGVSEGLGLWMGNESAPVVSLESVIEPPHPSGYGSDFGWECYPLSTGAAIAGNVAASSATRSSKAPRDASSSCDLDFHASLTIHDIAEEKSTRASKSDRYNDGRGCGTPPNAKPDAKKKREKEKEEKKEEQEEGDGRDNDERNGSATSHDDQFLIDNLSRELSKIRQENAIYRDRCRTLKSERDAAVQKAAQLESMIAAVKEVEEMTESRPADEKRTKKNDGGGGGGGVVGSIDDDSPAAAALRGELRAAEEEMRCKSFRLRNAEDEIDRLTQLLRVEKGDFNAVDELRRMEQLLRAKDAAFRAARDEVAELKAELDDVQRQKSKLEELQNENRRLRNKLVTSGHAA